MDEYPILVVVVLLSETPANQLYHSLDRRPIRLGGGAEKRLLSSPLSSLLSLSLSLSLGGLLGPVMTLPLEHGQVKGGQAFKPGHN